MTAISDPDPTAPFHSAEPPAPTGRTVGRLVLGEELGRGAFGVVCRAQDPVLGREVAVKLPTAEDASPERLERFTREARSAAGLRHRNIVTVFDVGDDAGRPFIVMELIDGPTLLERMREPVEPRQAAEWVRDLALALEHAHAAGVVHRDVKPGNVLLDGGRRVRLTDFGISKLPPAHSAEGESVTADGAVMGTPGYMSPEQARGDVSAVGPASDQYSLGVVLYELLTRRRPFPGSAAEAMRRCADPDAHPPRPREVDPSVPLGLEGVALKATSKAAAGRYPSAGDLAADLQRWLNGDAVSAPLCVPAGWKLRCPECGLGTPPPAVACRFCGRVLRGVEPSEPMAPSRAEPESGRPPFWTRERFARAGLWLVWLLVVAAAGAVFVANWRAAVEQAGGWDSTSCPSFLDTTPPFAPLGPLWRGVLLALCGIGVGVVALAALAGTERARALVELARWSAAGAAVLLAVWVETTTTYPRYTRYRLEVAVISISGRPVKRAWVQVMTPRDQERSLHNRVYADQARLRAHDPEREPEADARPPFFPGGPPGAHDPAASRTLHYLRSPLGFLSDPDPDRLLVLVGYEDDAGSCQCDDGVNVGFHHDHHELAFPLRLAVDANPAEARATWEEFLWGRPAGRVEPTRVTVEVP